VRARVATRHTRVVPLRIVFFGLPLAALLLARDGHEIALASICRPGSIGTRRLARTIGEGRVLVKPRATDRALLRRVEALAPDLLVSWFWTTKLPVALVAAAKHGGLGVHPSLLPRHRGPDPTYWAIASGDTETGVTVHRIAAEYDTGDVLAQERIAIDPSWTGWKLAKALDRPSLRQLRATVARFARGELVPALAQDEALATYAPQPTDEERAIRWASPTAEILRHVRALAPSPGAWTEIGGALVTVLAASEATSFPRALEPGEGAVIDGLPVVRTGDGAVVLRAAEVLDATDEDADEGAWRPASTPELAALFLQAPAPFLVG
jgi:methionyl-tRNA formyltransferase